MSYQRLLEARRPTSGLTIRDAFRVFGNPKTLSELKSAHRKLYLANHPDLTTDPEEREARNKKIGLINSAKDDVEYHLSKGLTSPETPAPRPQSPSPPPPPPKVWTDADEQAHQDKKFNDAYDFVKNYHNTAEPPEWYRPFGSTVHADPENNPGHKIMKDIYEMGVKAGGGHRLKGFWSFHGKANYGNYILMRVRPDQEIRAAAILHDHWNRGQEPVKAIFSSDYFASGKQGTSYHKPKLLYANGRWMGDYETHAPSEHGKIFSAQGHTQADADAFSAWVDKAVKDKK